MNGERYERLISTQITMKERLDANPMLQDRYFILADMQTAGRGRSDRQWVSSVGNLHASILIRTPPFSIPTWTPLWVSVCAHRSLIAFGVPADRLQLKWPNDLWLDATSKVSGVLCEKKGDTLIAGIGMNLMHSPLPESATVPFPDRIPLPETMVEKILFELSKDASVGEIREYYERYSLFKIGTDVTWNSKSQKKQGRVVGLGEYGELILETDSGRIPLYSEDVSGITPPKGKDRSP